MTHFPQIHPQQRAPRIQLGIAIPALVKHGEGERARAKLETVSVTGGLLQLGQALEEGDFVEVAFQTQSGPVHGMAEMLQPARKLATGILQPFRFIAMEDADHKTLAFAVNATTERNFLLGANQFTKPKSH